MDTVNYAGDMLLAMPGIGDPRFERAVIAMCVHDADGAMGIGIGSNMDGGLGEIGLHGLMRQLGLDPGEAPDMPVLSGGPVEPRRGFVLHSLDWTGQESINVGGRWGLSGSMDVLKAIAEGRGPDRYLVALGYAGWGKGQLEEELTRHGWAVVPATEAILFDTPPGERWSAAFGASGIDASHLSSRSGHA